MFFYNKLLSIYYKKKLSAIKLIVSDVDGVLTDGRIYIDDNGVETKSFSVLDGISIKIAQKAGIIFAVLSASDSMSIKHRFSRLAVSDVVFNTEKKVDGIKMLLEKYNLDASSVAYIGDDYIDISPMKFCSISFAPHNASKEAKKVSSIVLDSNGGHAAVREAITMILKSKGVYNNVIKYYTEFK